MWNPPGPGIKPMSPALAGELSTTLLPGKSWEHLYVNCLNSPVVGLGFEPWSVWLSLCAMVSYLYKFISFDYKIHHIREKVGQSGRCAMDLQFLYWVPRIIILNNPFHESNISKALPHSYPSPWPQESCRADVVRTVEAQEVNFCSMWQELGLWHQIFGFQNPWSSQHKPDLAMMGSPSTWASLGKAWASFPPNSTPSLLAHTRSEDGGLASQLCSLLSGHTWFQGLTWASPAAWNLFRLLTPPPPWFCHCLPSSLGAESPLTWGILWNESLYLVPTARGGCVLEGPEVGPAPLQQSQVPGSRTKGSPEPHFPVGEGALCAEKGLLLLGSFSASLGAWQGSVTLCCFYSDFVSRSWSYFFPSSSVGKESACNAGNPSSIPGLGRPLEKDRLPTPVFLGFPGGSVGKESCNVGDLGLIPGLGRSPGEGNGY